MAPQTRRDRSISDTLAVLDVGSSKITCLVAVRGGEQPAASQHGISSPVRIVGYGSQRSAGVKAGVIVDLSQAEGAIRAAIDDAEATAGVAVAQVVVAVAGGRLASANFRARTDVGGHALVNADIARVMTAGQAYAERDGRRLVHLNRIAWRLDDQANIRDPRGLRGRMLEADLHAATVDEMPLRNLLIAVERTYVRVASLVVAPFAAGLAVTSAEERRYGATVVDIGEGLTTLAFFADGHLVNVDAVTLGGGQVTYDIAQALTIPLAEAARIKALYGTLIAASSDEHEVVQLQQSNDDAANPHVTRARLRDVIRPRVVDALRILRARIDANPTAPFATGRIVLTGGGSQLPGIADQAASALSRPVRLGRPHHLGGLPEHGTSPVHAVGIGLVDALFVPGACVLATGPQGAVAQGGYLGQVGSWLREIL